MPIGASKSNDSGTFQHPTNDVLRIARTMSDMAVSGTPRNYEMFHAAMSGQFLTLQHDLSSLGKNPTQTELDLLYSKHIMQSRIDAIVQDAPEQLGGTIAETMDLMRTEHKSLAAYQKVLGETARKLSSDEIDSEEMFSRFLDIVANATSATMEHGRNVMRNMATKTSELEELRGKLEEYKTLADKDSLTGLWNRRAFDRLCGGVGTGPGKQGAFILLDIDHFKRLNDTYGHPFGDFVIKRVGEVLQKNLRAGTLVFRAGGEEYAVFLDKMSLDACRLTAKRLNRAIAAENFSDGDVELQPGDVTVSIGLCCQDRATTGRELYAQADEALYKSKENGRDRVTIYGEEAGLGAPGVGETGEQEDAAQAPDGAPGGGKAGAEDNPDKRRNWYMYR